LHTGNICFQKGRSVKNASVDVRLGSEIYNRPWFLFFKNSPNQNLIANVTPYKLDTICWNICKIL